VLVAYNGVEPHRAVDERERVAVREKHGVDANTALVLVIARLRPVKGIDDLISAIALLTDRAVRLIVLGTGPEEQRLRAHAAALRAPVDFVGYQDDIAPWLAAADVVAMPSRRESFGLVAIEAMAAGRPLVACAVGGLTEIIEDRRTGFLVPPRDPRTFAAAIVTILEDPTSSEAIASAARVRWQSQFTIESMVNGWIAAYAHFLSGK
jgi:glycosyltransferase involved in cell wall biosynthesis